MLYGVVYRHFDISENNKSMKYIDYVIFLKPFKIKWLWVFNIKWRTWNMDESGWIHNALGEDKGKYMWAGDTKEAR